MAIAGRVAIVPKGDWSADVTYKRLDAVTYNNTLYFAKKDVPAGTATSNTEYWSKSIVGGVGAIAKPEEAGIVKPDGKSMSVDESGTLSINLDGATITLDEAKNVIKLADTLKDAINGAFPAANVANNQITTVEGFALDARQANPNIDGSLAKQISDLNGSLYNIKCIQSYIVNVGDVQANSACTNHITFGKSMSSKNYAVITSFVSATAYWSNCSVCAINYTETGFDIIVFNNSNYICKQVHIGWIAIEYKIMTDVN